MDCPPTAPVAVFHKLRIFASAKFRCLSYRKTTPPVLLPGLPSQATHKIEMAIAAHDWNRILPAKSRDPQVIGRNRLPRALQFQSNRRVVPSRLNANDKDFASIQHSPQRSFVGLAVALLRDSKSKLPGYDYGSRKLARLGDNLNCFRRSVQTRRKRLCIQNQLQYSASIYPNSSSMIFCIRSVSSCR